MWLILWCHIATNGALSSCMEHTPPRFQVWKKEHHSCMRACARMCVRERETYLEQTCTFDVASILKAGASETTGSSITHTQVAFLFWEIWHTNTHTHRFHTFFSMWTSGNISMTNRTWRWYLIMFFYFKLLLYLWHIKFFFMNWPQGSSILDQTHRQTNAGVPYGGWKWEGYDPLSSN